MLRLSRQYKQVLALVGFLLLIVVVLAGCSDDPPKSIKSPPTYPNATQVKDRALGPDDALLFIYKSVTFVTLDKPDSVLKFYRDALKSDGWQELAFQPDPNALELKWVSAERPPATYWIDVQTSPAVQGESGTTNVEIDLRDGATN